jgi:hypothetical protein
LIKAPADRLVSRRLVLGAEARWLGHGGIELVTRALGISRKTVAAGAAELESRATCSSSPACPALCGR